MSNPTTEKHTPPFDIKSHPDVRPIVKCCDCQSSHYMIKTVMILDYGYVTFVCDKCTRPRRKNL